MGDFPCDTDTGATQVLIAVENFTRYIELVPLKPPITAVNVLHGLFRGVIRNHGFPVKLSSDRGSNIKLEELCRILKIARHFGRANHSQSKGKAERQVRVVTDALKKTCHDPRRWCQELPLLQFSLNTMRSKATGVTPYLLMRGMNARTITRALMEFNMAVEDCDFEDEKEANKRYGNDLGRVLEDVVKFRLEFLKECYEKAKKVESEFICRYLNKRNQNGKEKVKYRVGDVVMVYFKGKQDKLDTHWKNPFWVTKVYEEETKGVIVEVQHIFKKSWKFDCHVSRMALFSGKRLTKEIASRMRCCHDQFYVEKIVGHKFVGKKLFYKVHWEGFEESDDTWQSPQSLKDSADLVKEYRLVHHLDGQRR